MSKCRICGEPKPPISQIRGVCNSFECLRKAREEQPVEPKLRSKIKTDVKKLKRKVDRFYKFGKYQWDKRKNKRGQVHCEETGKLLGYDFDPKLGHGMCISHILPKSTYPEAYYHPLNCNVLSHEAHRQWEFGDKNSMQIYEKNLKIIQEIKDSLDSQFDE